MESAHDTIAMNLGELGVSADALTKPDMLNISTGSESLVSHQLKVKVIPNLNVSMPSVS